MTRKKNRSVLGLHPSSRGFGWIVFEGPSLPFDWGTAVHNGKDKNARSLMRIEILLEKYRPGAIAIESFEGKGSRRQPRVRSLYRAIVRTAKRKGVEVHVASRAEIRDALDGAETRGEVAAAVASRIEALRPRLPKPRKIWLGEHPSLALFSAAACALACYAARPD